MRPYLSSVLGLLSSGQRSWPIFPAQPKEVESEKRNKPPVAILFVVAPLGAQMPAADEPQRPKGETQGNDRPPGTVQRRRFCDWCSRSEDGAGHGEEGIIN